MKNITLTSLTICSMAFAQENDNTVLATANNDLALKLMKQLGKEGENLCISPYSIQSALSMTTLGAAGQTHAEMASALSHPKDDPKAIHNAFEVYQNQLSKRLGDSEKSLISLKVANKLFVDQSIKLHQPFTVATQKHYGSPVLQMDFQNKPEEQRKKINTWVSDNTEDRIKDLLPERSVTSDTALVITNATYFKAEWKYPFKASSTRKREFHHQDGNAVEVDFMSLSRAHGYTETEKYQVVSMPYGKEKPMQFTVVLPKEGNTVEEVVAGLTAQELGDFKQLPQHYVSLKLPKFEQKGSSIKLRLAMQSLGMKAAFAGADFSKITSEPLAVSDIFHQTFLKIDEKGGEAAAATAVVMRKSASKPGDKKTPIRVDVNRPFFYAIQDSQTGLCLFVGMVNQLK